VLRWLCMQERVGKHFPDRAVREQERQELIRLDGVESYIWGKAGQFSDDLMLTEDLAQEAREAVIKRLWEDVDCPASHLKIKARDAIYHYRGRGSSVDGKLHPINRTKPYQTSSIDNDENGCLRAEAVGEPQAIRRVTEEKAFNNVLFDGLRAGLSKTENQVLTLRLSDVSWKEVRGVLGLEARDLARIRRRLNITVQMVLGLSVVE